MEILPNIEIKGLALHFKDIHALVISDLQIGYEQNMISAGVLLPKFQFKDIVKQFESLLKNKKYSKIIINGDLKHEFGRINEQEWRETLRLIDFITKHCNELVFVKGNHDLVLGPIAKKRNIKLVEDYLLGDILFVHGNKEIEIPKNAKIIVIGHEHPAVSLRNDVRVEKYKCFLKGKYKDKILLVLPSFNKLTTGTDILSEKTLSPFLKKNLKNFEVFVVEGGVYYFGKVKDI